MHAEENKIHSEQRSYISEDLWPGQRDDQHIQYHSGKIEVGTPFQIEDDILLLRLPLPFALNHINVYLVQEADGWALIDCGVNTAESRKIWEAVVAELGSLSRIIVTHHHPDHVGLAGWLADRFDVSIAMTEGEYAVAGRYADPDRDIVAERSPLWQEHGLSAEKTVALLERMPRYTQLVSELRDDKVQILNTEVPLRIGNRSWLSIVGGGHSPDHLSLLDEAGEVLIGGDQILPQITPNIAVWPGGDQDPLTTYFTSLRKFMDITPETLLLPSHHQPLYGAAGRARQIYAHHDERLGVLWDACEHAMNACDLIPALFGRPLRDSEMGFGLGEAIAHLNYLETEGYMVSHTDDNGIRLFERL